MPLPRNAAWACAGLLCALALAPSGAQATTVRRHLSLIDLLKESETIVHGRVKSVTDGIDSRGIPYTEVTLQVAEALKGQTGAEYTFRQFGLLAPRKMGDGRVNLMVTPAAWSTYQKGQEAIYFLRKPAAWTGLRTTAGLSQGQFKVSVGGVSNGASNAGLFDRVQVDPGLLGETEQRVMATSSGALNARGFKALVKQAVEGKWVETGRMRHADR
jgi:hypothetical protein